MRACCSKSVARRGLFFKTVVFQISAEYVSRRCLIFLPPCLTFFQVDRAEQAPPPVMIVVMGPRGSGKTTLIRSLIKLYTGETSSPVLDNSCCSLLAETFLGVAGQGGGEGWAGGRGCWCACVCAGACVILLIFDAPLHVSVESQGGNCRVFTDQAAEGQDQGQGLGYTWLCFPPCFLWTARKPPSESL